MMGVGQQYPYMAQQPMQMPQQIPQVQPQQQNQQRNWVQGIAGAKSFLVAPGQTVDLWDSEDTIIYLKSADASGIPSMQILDYTVRSQPGKPQPLQQIQTDDFVTRKEFDELNATCEKLKEAFDQLKEAKKNAKPAV